MKIYIGSDHAGFELKGKLIPFLHELGYTAEDMGAFVYDETDDYPDFISAVARAVSADPESKGIVLGKSGQGEAMSANKQEGIRAALWYGGELSIIKLSRTHNDANVLSLGSGFINENEAKHAIKLWLDTPFSGDERHIRRINKINNL
ncbi:MAG: ribose-5-phosphate isomerase ribose 5-phosphate isomerase [Parcubacteria group bacterium]|nr:ribose-5-phosphate isomerase ribose 5-phosphate isomerase [Parcubacteria group bacterium]